MTNSLPNQRWQIAKTDIEKVSPLVQSIGLYPLLAQVLINRGTTTLDEATIYVNPESQQLPSPLDEFKDLGKSVDLLCTAIADSEKIAICGDYDADGMTSTALLLRALRHLGADVDYAIPSRMKEGYGINTRIVEEFANAGIGLILTVDNGIAAYEPVQRAVDLGLTVIITDHHDLPEEMPPADAILNPKMLSDTSPYKGLAGVGVAYVLAVKTAQKLGLLKGLTNQLLELFTLGTIADLAPLVGVNRRWLKRGLRRLPQSELAGVQALIQVSGVNDQKKALKPDDIGFRLGPRINAIGRIYDPQVVIELLTTDDPGLALERAMQCEQINSKRQQLCAEIEHEAVSLIEENNPEHKLLQWRENRVLVIVQPNWHHGVIGIVASRLVERYGVPVFIGTYEDEEKKHVRGSARGIPEFNVFDALEYCKDILGKFGGHKAAGGFSLPGENLTAFGEKLREFSHQCLQPEHIKPLVTIDAQADFKKLTHHFYEQIESLQPWGIGNPSPVFWTSQVQILEQKKVGKNHLQLTILQNSDSPKMKAIAWRWGEYYPLPKFVDIAYKVIENNWNGNSNIELEIVGVRQCEVIEEVVAKEPEKKPESQIKKARFEYGGRSYACSFWESLEELRIRNSQGKVLAVKKGQRVGLLGTSRDTAQEVNVTQSPYYDIVKAANQAIKNA